MNEHCDLHSQKNLIYHQFYACKKRAIVFDSLLDLLFSVCLGQQIDSIYVQDQLHELCRNCKQFFN